MGIFNDKPKIISNDNGRSFNKSFCNTSPNGVNKSNAFQSTMAPAELHFNLTVETKPSDLWIEHSGENWLIGDLAVRQRPKKLITDRDPDKTNRQNILLTLVACSLYARGNEEIILLTNVPARDYSGQRRNIESALKGEYRIFHKAGDMAGKLIPFRIGKCYSFPEGESAYYGAAYDLDLNLVNQDIIDYSTLIMDIGDETINYISMGPGGEPQDDSSGTLKRGFHEVYVDIHKWLTGQGADVTLPQLTRSIIFNLPVFIGGKQMFYYTQLNKRYSEFEYSVYSELNSLLSLRQYRNVIFVGGSITPLKPLLEKRYEFMQQYFTAGSQMLNCYGQYIIYRLTQEG